MTTPQRGVGRPREQHRVRTVSALGLRPVGAWLWCVMPDFRPLTNWRRYNGDRLPDGWAVTGDGLKLERPGHETTGGDIVTAETFGDFELRLGWNVSEGGNSGVFYLVDERPDVDWAWMTGLEMQVLDDDRHPDARNGRDRWSGGLYALYDVPDPSPINPAGDWNAATVRLEKGNLKHVINGQTILDIDLNGDDFKQRLAASKFAKFEHFLAAYRAGEPTRLGLQDHGDVVTFRDIEVRDL